MGKNRAIAILGIFLLLIVGLPLVMAASMDPFSSLLNLLQSAINIVFKIFNLNFLGLDVAGANRVAFMRFMIWIITFAIFNAALKLVLSRGSMARLGSAGNGRLPAIISICLATITAVFMPSTVLLAIGLQYSAVWSATILGGLFAGLLYVAYGMVKPLPQSAGGHLLRLGILFVCWILLLNFTAVTDNPLGYTPSMSNTNITFNNPVLGFLWELLSAIVGILIIFEIFQVFRAAGNSSGRSGQSPNPAGPTPNSSGGRGNRPPGRQPPPTPPQRNPTDPPMPDGAFPPGIVPSVFGPKPKAPQAPAKPRIPDEEEIFIDLSPRFNGIRSQDSLSACTAFAATSIFEYILHAGYSHPPKYLSPLYLWYRTRERLNIVNQNTGFSTNLIPLNNLINDGVCFEELWKFEEQSTNKWQTPPPSNAVQDASQKRILSVNSVPKDDPDQWVRQLQEGNPLDIAVHFPRNMISPYTKSFYDNFVPDYAGGHAMVIVGYHSHYPYNGRGVKAFKIRNSHDTKWGENGYTWVQADALQKMLMEDPYVILGWAKGRPADSTQKYRISGRAVFDDNAESRIPASWTGRQIYEYPSFGKFDHKFYVGLIAQTQEDQYLIIEQKEVADPEGRFSIDLEADFSEFKPLTLLSLLGTRHKGFASLVDIPFGKLPPGIVVFKSTEKIKGKISDQEMYFHTVPLNYSQAGRGGEGARNPDNPCSVTYQHINCSGIPIILDKNHREEQNVIIPVHPYAKAHPSALGSKPGTGDMAEKEAEQKLLAEAKKFAESENQLLDDELRIINFMIEDIKGRKFESAKSNLQNIAALKNLSTTYTRNLDYHFKMLLNNQLKTHKKGFNTLYEKLHQSDLYIIELAGTKNKELAKYINQLIELSGGQGKEKTPQIEEQIQVISAKAQKFLEDTMRQLLSVKKYLGTVMNLGEKKTSPSQK